LNESTARRGTLGLHSREWSESARFEVEKLGARELSETIVLAASNQHEPVFDRDRCVKHARRAPVRKHGERSSLCVIKFSRSRYLRASVLATRNQDKSRGNTRRVRQDARGAHRAGGRERPGHHLIWQTQEQPVRRSW